MSQSLNNKHHVSGLHMLKRKGLWVNRFIEVDSQQHLLVYRNSAEDKTNKYFMDLLGCTLQRGFIDKAETKPFVKIFNEN